MDKDKTIKKQRILLICLALVILALVVSIVVIANNKSNSENTENQPDIIQNEDKEDLTGLPVYKSGRIPNYIEYVAESGARFYYPYGWISAGTEESPIFVKNDDSVASVNFMTTEYPTGVEFNYYLEKTKESLTANVTLDGDASQQFINLNGKKACRVDYVAVQDDTKLKVTQIIFVEDDTVYILTTTADLEKYENVKQELENIIKTFKKV